MMISRAYAKGSIAGFGSEQRRHIGICRASPAQLLSGSRIKVLTKASRDSSQSGSFYPNIPPVGYTPEEPSAPYLPNGTPSYNSSQYGSQYGTSSNPSLFPSSSTGVSEADLLADADIEQLRSSAGTTRSLSFLGFWLQFALSIVSAGILLFSAAFVPKGGNAVADISKYLTLGGVIAAFISSLMAHGFLTLSRKLVEGGNVTRRYLAGTLLTNNAICLAGIFITVIGLQASVGTLVAKSLMTAMSGPYSLGTSGNVLVSLDVFALQASTNTLLCHVIGLLYTNLMLRLVNRAPKTATA